MAIKDLKLEFEKHIPEKVYESKMLKFNGIDGFTVYNCSIPFKWKDGKEYIYGRVEKLDEWARSLAYLFEKTGEDEFTLVKDHMIYQLEDPYVAIVQGEMVMGGTHVRKRSGEIDTYYGYFYRGTDLNDLFYFTTGPDEMKDIRLVDMQNGKIGVFSRPRSAEIEAKYGSSAIIGFATINNLDELTDDVILNARPIEGVFDQGEWGGCNQAYMLENGNIGVIGHQSYMENKELIDKPLSEFITSAVETEGDERPLAVYVSTAFEFNPETFEATHNKVIATRSCYPDANPKLPYLADCTFTSGIVMRDDGKVDLYGGLGDTREGRIVIDYPFSSPIRK